MFIRVEARDALKKALEALTDVKVTKGFDGPDSVHEEIYLGPTSGSVDYTVFLAGAMPHDDTFSIDVLVRAAKSGQTQDRAEVRAQELMSLVDAALRDPTFDNLFVQVTTPSALKGEASIIDAVLADADGPHTEPTDQGWRGYGAVTVAVRTRSVYQ